MNQPQQGAGTDPVHDNCHDMLPDTLTGPNTEVQAPQEDAPCRNRTYNLVIKSHPRNAREGDTPSAHADGSGDSRACADGSDPDPDSHFHDKSHDAPTRRCPRCEADKSLGEFGSRLDRGRRKPQPYCRLCMVDFHRDWRATPEGRSKFTASRRESVQRYPERDRARRTLRKAVKAGRIQRGACYAGGPDCAGEIQAHHDDYSRPLEVVWTCVGHHRALDRARQQREAA